MWYKGFLYPTHFRFWSILGCPWLRLNPEACFTERERGFMEESTITQRQTIHVKKKALRNKSLGISFDEKDLKDYVTGFHKRKKKRRKEANKQQEEARRRKRNEGRLKVTFFFVDNFICYYKIQFFYSLFVKYDFVEKVGKRPYLWNCSTKCWRWNWWNWSERRWCYWTSWISIYCW